MRAAAAAACVTALLLVGCPPGDDDDASEDPTPPVGGGPHLVLPEPPEGCPGGGGGEGEGEGEGTLRVGGAAIYCATFDETRNLAQERAAKALLWLPEGDLAFPLEEGAYPWRLPACARFADGREEFAEEDGTLTVSPELPGDRYRLTIRQPLGDEELLIQLSGPAADLAAGPGLDGEHVGLATETDRDVSMQLGALLLDSCTFARVPAERHTVIFEGGGVELDLRIGQSFASTQPAIFVGGEGSLDGEPFAVRDYFDAIYSPEHHHFSRDFVLMLDDDRGLLIADADPFFDPPPTTVRLVDGLLQTVEERAVTTEDYDPTVIE